jgi:hypothetical protein
VLQEHHGLLNPTSQISEGWLTWYDVKSKKKTRMHSSGSMQP